MMYSLQHKEVEEEKQDEELGGEDIEEEEEEVSVRKGISYPRIPSVFRS